LVGSPGRWMSSAGWLPDLDAVLFSWASGMGTVGEGTPHRSLQGSTTILSCRTSEVWMRSSAVCVSMRLCVVRA
jgi:hypothetical protein